MADPEKRTVEIVGVVQDAKYRSMRAPVPPTMYMPFAQHREHPGDVGLALRWRGPAAVILREVNAMLSREYPNLSFQLLTLETQIEDSVFQERLLALLFAALGILALALAAVGIYGVLSYLIERRRPEFGIRMALGATPGDVRRLIYTHSFATLGAGAIAGALLALWGAKFTQKMLYGVTPAQPGVYALVAALLAVVALGATVVPAARASRKDIAGVLRSE